MSMSISRACSATIFFNLAFSPFMIGLAVVLIVIGILFIPFYGGSTGVIYGLVFIALGLASLFVYRPVQFLLSLWMM